MQSMNIFNTVQIFFRRRNCFIYPFILTVFIAVVLSFTLPKVYESSAKILIEEEKIINPLIGGLAVSTTAAQRLRILEEQILGWNSLAELTRRLKLDAHVNSKLDFEKLIEEIRNRINVELQGQQLLTITFQGNNPAEVQTVTRTITDIFIEQNLKAQTKETDVALTFLADQLRSYKRKIKEGEIKALKEELDTLLFDSTENHPLVKNLRKQIKLLEANLEVNIEDNDAVSYKEELADRHFTSQFSLAEAETDSLGGKVYTRSKNGNNLAENDLTGLALDSQVNREIYAMLLKRLETARITKELDNFKEGTSFTIIESPRLPLKHVKPNKIIFLLGGIFCGVVVGYTCVYIIEMLDTSYQSLNEAKADLQPVPVLGSISAIITEREFNRRQQGARFTYAAMGIIFIIIVAFVLLFSLFN